MTLNLLLKETESKMIKAIENLKTELASVRTGRASLALLDGIKVEAYGGKLPIKQVAALSIPEPRVIVIQPFDVSVLPAIERAILKSNLGITPANDGKVIRLTLPPLTEENRIELTKTARRLAEESRIVIRAVRRDAIETIRKMKKEGTISEDECKREEKRVQELHDKYIEEINELLAKKEKEILS